MNWPTRQAPKTGSSVSLPVRDAAKGFAVLLGTLLLSTIILTAVSTMYAISTARLEVWLLLTGGLFMLGALATWAITRFVVQYFAKPLAQLQAGLARAPHIDEPADKAPGTTRQQRHTWDSQPASTQVELNERQQVEAEMIQRNRELTTLQAAGAAITSSLDFRHVLNTVTQEMAKLLAVECCTISEWNEWQDTVTVIAKYGPDGWSDPASLTQVHSMAKYPLTREVLEKQLPRQMSINQPDLDPTEAASMRQANIQTRLLLPMIFQGRVMGLVELEDSQTERTFTEHEVSLARLLANQAASAIENARLYHEMDQYLEELTTLSMISQAITSTLDIQEMLTIINNHFTEVLGVAATSVALHDKTKDELWFATASGEGAEYVRGKRLAKGQGIVGWVIERGEPVLIPDVSNEDHFYDEIDQESGFTTRSILCVPLQTKGQTIGAIEAMNKINGPFDEEDLRLLTSLAAPAATAIENAQLYEDLEKERALLAQRVEQRTEELSRANTALNKAARLKDEFLAGMSHELRTPLNAILGAAEILQTEVFGALNEKQMKYSHAIEESGRHLFSLINDILDVSKIEAGKVELEIRPIAIESVCEASLRMVKQLAHRKQLKVLTTIDNTITTLQADERRLKQILVNLLSNAIKFTPEGGQVGLEVVADRAQQAVHFTVWDTGIGISPEDMTRLFQPFVQLDSSLTRQYTGTGLGLSLVSRLTDLHGGGVSVESEVGQGSRFIVSLPWSEPASPVHEQEPEAGRPPVLALDQQSRDNQPLILMADDNEDNVTMLSDYLMVRGYRVAIARNGHEALERARQDRPDLILMDVQMPGMDGLEATRRLRAEASLSKLPVIAITALAMPGDRERCLQAGADVYLSKPISLEGLVKTIEAHLSAR